MVEALIGRGGRRIDAVAGRDRRDEDVNAAQLEIDARLALLHGPDHLRAEHALVIARGRLRIGAAQVDVIVGELGHGGGPPSVAHVPLFAVGLALGGTVAILVAVCMWPSQRLANGAAMSNWSSTRATM